MKQLRTVAEIPALDKMSWCRRILAGEKWTFTFFSITPFVVWCHWCSGRTVSCTEPISECRGHQLGAPLKLLSYFHGFNHQAQREEWLELPQGAGHKFMSALGGEQLRGSRAVFERGKGKCAHIEHELLSRHEHINPSAKLTKPETPEKHLRRMWGLNESLLKLHEVAGLSTSESA